MTAVLVPRDRFERWVLNFRGRHGATGLTVVAGALHGAASDGSSFVASLPFGAAYGGLPSDATFALSIQPLDSWGVLLVRKGGFAVARLAGATVSESKVGQRHVQGRTKAGGQSQQRFARRRDNQARRAYEAAADHAARVLGSTTVVVAGGDHAAVTEVLEDPRLAHLSVSGPWLPVPDPRRAVLDAAIADACSASVEVVNA